MTRLLSFALSVPLAVVLLAACIPVPIVVGDDDTDMPATCSCNEHAGICDAAGNHTTAACACDGDCGTDTGSAACADDGVCDVKCDPYGTCVDPDCDAAAGTCDVEDTST